MNRLAFQFLCCLITVAVAMVTANAAASGITHQQKNEIRSAHTIGGLPLRPSEPARLADACVSLQSYDRNDDSQPHWSALNDNNNPAPPVFPHRNHIELGVDRAVLRIPQTQPHRGPPDFHM